MKVVRWAAVALAMVAALASCSAKPESGQSQYESKDKLHQLIPNEIDAVVAEPDATTKALLAGNMHPFGIRYGEAGNVILYGVPGSSVQSGHGPMAQPWASRLLERKPVDPKDWHKFKDSLVVVIGDDWKETRNIARPTGLPFADFQCTSRSVTAEGLKQLPAAIGKYEASADFPLPLAGTVWKCRKTAAASPAPSKSPRR